MSLTRGTPRPATTAQTSLDGRLLTHEQPEFDRARQAWNLTVDQQPAAIVSACSPDDVAAALQLASERGLRVAAQATGHGAAPLGPLEDTVLLKTDGMRAVQIDAERGIARIEAGVVWQEAVEAAARHRLALLAGSSSDVGVVGYTLGGGLGWLGRKHGLAANSVHAIELVTPDGRLIRADDSREQDLFWALRGGGGSFAVVTAIEMRVFPITDVYAGILWWPIDRGEEVLQSWRELTQRDMPDELTTVGRYLQVPDLPGIPEPVRGRSFAVVEAFHLGDPADADEVLAPLRALAPENDTFDTVPVQALTFVHMEPEYPVPSVGDGLMLAELPEEAIDKLVRIAGAGVQSPLVSVEIRQLGGELARPRAGHGAISHLEAPYALFAVGIASTPQNGHAIRAYVEHLQAALAPWTAPQMYANFADTRRDARTLWPEAALQRLREIKQRVDPDDVIRANHPIAPA